MTKCDPYGENLAKTVIIGIGWTYHHDVINVQIHNIAKQATMNNETKITYYFMRKLKDSAALHDSHLPLLTSRQLRRYVPDGRHDGIATNKHPTGVYQFVEIKVNHSGCVQYGRPEVRDNHNKGGAAVQYFQSHVGQQHITQLKRKNGINFGTNADRKGLLESLFRQLDFKPMVFATFGEMSSNVKDFIYLAVDYRAEHLGKSMAASTMDTVGHALKRRYRAQLSMASWRGYAKEILDRTKYVGGGIDEDLNREHIRLGMIDMAN